MSAREVSAAYDFAAPLYQTELAPDSFSRTVLKRWSTLLPSGSRVMDIGCGAGRATRWLEQHGYMVLSLDLSTEMLQRTRDGRPKAWVALADMRALPAASGSFDGLTAFFSLSHIPKTEVPSVLMEFRRALKHDGAILISVGRGQDDYEKTAEWAGGHIMHFSSFIETELEDLLVAAGFRTIGSQTCEATVQGEVKTHLFTLAQIS